MKVRHLARIGGFSLLETLAVLTISAVLMAFAVPGLGKNSEVVRLDKAASDLRCIWRAERRHRLERGVFTDSLAALEAAGYIRPALVSADDPYTYQVTVGKRAELIVEAKRTGSSHWYGTLRIDELGEISGDVKSKDGDLLTP
jgi:prepilin-type N-terminal cleavage/methylation domain-containing protein